MANSSQATLCQCPRQQARANGGCQIQSRSARSSPTHPLWCEQHRLVGRFCPRRGSVPLGDPRGWKRGLDAQGSGFLLTTRESVMGTRAGKTPVRLWMLQASYTDILILRQTPHPYLGYSQCGRGGGMRLSWTGMRKGVRGGADSLNFFEVIHSSLRENHLKNNFFFPVSAHPHL